MATAVRRAGYYEWQDGKRHFPKASLAPFFTDGQDLLSTPVTAGLVA